MLGAAYADIDADAIPTPPETWNPQDPSEEDLETAFGELFVAVSNAVDPSRDGSVVVEMGEAAELLGIGAQ